MGMLEVQEKLKAGYFTESDSREIRVNYDAYGVKIDRIVKVWHLGENWYELREHVVDSLPLGKWIAPVEQDGMLTLVVCGSEKDE